MMQEIKNFLMWKVWKAILKPKKHKESPRNGPCGEYEHEVLNKREVKEHIRIYTFIGPSVGIVVGFKFLHGLLSNKNIRFPMKI